eukprot:NODE_235_length_2063_cov_72.094340_g201_i0.p1 GENE.NODE_235_length_2063_cov_72.094340_g201_i0~~NODE_235_length_2063_cov_72.094340_g201_i0.p1  ORF type:complete len:189 (+),score=22.00 NODE_235_length_2063_cov_72.094340_g201_i0:1285-1851(+)
MLSHKDSIRLFEFQDFLMPCRVVVGGNFFRNAIAPVIRQHSYNNVLWIGTAEYTIIYEYYGFGKVYATIDIDVLKTPFGSHIHLTTNVVDLPLHFAPGTFDFVFFTGVLGSGGWGKTKSEQHEAFAAIAHVVRPNGWLYLWYAPLQLCFMKLMCYIFFPSCTHVKMLRECCFDVFVGLLATLIWLLRQ